jgi:competence protein CoiA
MERVLKGVRPDVSLYIKRRRVAIEIQRSNISVDLINHRMLIYAKLGIHVLWVIPYARPALKRRQGLYSDFEPSVYHIKKWEKHLHAMYYGRLYFWSGSALVTPYHFTPATSWIEETEFGGGYEKTLKRLRHPKAGKTVHIANLIPRTRKRWRDVPSCKIMIDRQKNWWT